MIAGDRLVLERFAGLRVVGRYQIAYLVGNLGASFVAALNGAWLPLVFGGSDENRWEILADTTATLYRLAALVVGALALAAPVVLRLVASPSFDPARLTPITAVVAFGVLPYVTAAANVLTLLHLGKATYLTWATPLAAASNIFLNIVLVPRYGMGAAAATTVIAWVVLAVLLKARTRQLVRIPWRSGVAARTWGLAGALVVVGSLCPTTGWWLGARLAGTAAVLVGFANAITVVLRGGTSRYRPAHRGRRVLPASGRHFRARTGGRHR